MNIPPAWLAIATSKVNEILREAFPLRAPVPINDLIEAYVGDVKLVTSMESVFPEGVSAFSTKDPKLGWIVAVNGREPLVRRRFSAAHELAHIVLLPNQQKKMFCSGNDSDWIERLCDRFAGDILLPEELVRALYQSNSNPSLEEIAATFKVSRPVAEIQLKRLGLSFTRLTA